MAIGRIARWFGLGVLAGALGLPLHAITWEFTQRDLAAAPGQADVRTAFPFRNSSDRPVRVTAVAADCSCVLAHANRKTYAPGERGEISVNYEVGARTGPQRAVVTVSTDEPGVAPQPLTLQLTLPPRAATPAAKSAPLPAILQSAAGLAWASLSVDCTAELDQREVTAVYRFRNASARPVTILNVEPGCSCTQTTLAKKSYAPGEEGEIGIVFTVGDRTGLQEKIITVATDAPDAAPAQLMLRVAIREYLQLMPRVATWRLDEEPVERTLVCRATTAAPLLVHSARAAHPGFAVRIETVEPDRLYRVHVKPSTTHEPISTLVEISVEIAGVGRRTFSAYAYIHRR
ncbi:MAG: DUF1573 domain-containing protein [Opitutae bacterium]|nr:DUF1573 domain-containing protein [Opitutae bacterium]